jgi:hypothetical protein
MAAGRQRCGNTKRSPSAKKITCIAQSKAAIAAAASGRSDTTATAAATRVPWPPGLQGARSGLAVELRGDFWPGL